MGSKDDDIAIDIKDVSKRFLLPHQRSGTLKSSILNPFKRYKNETQLALKDVSLQIKKGEFFGIVGRNGSGKSTLLKCIAGVYTPDEGQITINGSLVPFIELGVGFNPELSGRDNVFLNGALLGFSRQQMEKLYDDIVVFAELEKFMDQKLKNYSSGMQVRLAFSIAIKAKGDILLLDEVLAVGDANFQKKCYEYFRKLKRENRTVLLVSHNIDSIRNFCDRALLLEKSGVAMVGSVEGVTDTYIKNNIDSEQQSNSQGTNVQKNKTSEGVIRSVMLLDSHDRKIQNFVGGGVLKVKIFYAVGSNIEKIHIGLGLYTDSNSYVLGYSTQMDEYRIEKTRDSITLTLEELPLLSGRYYFNVVCFEEDETVPLGYEPRAVTFDVHAFGSSKLYRGIINVKHTWVQ